MSEPYRCGTCGTGALVIRSEWLAAELAWKITCGNGHVLVPVPGFELWIQDESDWLRPGPDVTVGTLRERYGRTWRWNGKGWVTLLSATDPS